MEKDSMLKRHSWRDLIDHLHSRICVYVCFWNEGFVTTLGVKIQAKWWILKKLGFVLITSNTSINDLRIVSSMQQQNMQGKNIKEFAGNRGISRCKARRCWHCTRYARRARRSRSVNKDSRAGYYEPNDMTAARLAGRLLLYDSKKIILNESGKINVWQTTKNTTNK